MCDTVFAFGPQSGYMFECPSRRELQNLPASLGHIYNEQVVAKTYCLAIGPNDSYVLSYKATNGKTQIASQHIPQALTNWLYEKNASGKHVRNFVQLSVTLGPSGTSYFALDGTSFARDNLPAGLHAELQKKLNSAGQFSDAPRIVSLGFGGDYFMLTQNNACSYSLSNYPELNTIMPTLRDNIGLHTMKTLVLSPHARTMCAGYFTNGTSFAEGMPLVTLERMQALDRAIRADTQAALRQTPWGQQQLAQQQQMARLANVARDNELSRRRVRLSEQQMQASSDSIDRIGRIGTGCRCYSRFCTCGSSIF
jgi:hypothetical protein